MKLFKITDKFESLYFILFSILTFAVVYNYLGDDHFIIKNDFGRLDFFNSLHYSLTNQSLLGSGEVTPKTRQAKMIVMAQLLVTLVVTFLY
jgi:hypothetical protein